MYFPKPHNILIYLSYSGKSLWYVSSIDSWVPFKECPNYPEYSSKLKEGGGMEIEDTSIIDEMVDDVPLEALIGYDEEDITEFKRR